jgi:hypothetical protein
MSKRFLTPFIRADRDFAATVMADDESQDCQTPAFQVSPLGKVGVLIRPQLQAT